MARDEAPPFARGSTFYNGGTIDTSNLGGAELEGKVYRFEDIDWDTTGGAKPNRTNRLVTCMVVRNNSGINLLPRRLASLQLTAGVAGKVDGYATTTAAPGYPIDEFLPSAGVPNGDLFYIVIDGPAEVLTDLAAAAGNVISVGDSVVALTAATSQATTAGRVAAQDLTGATTPLALQVQNRIGKALSAATTNNTNTALLVDVRKW